MKDGNTVEVARNAGEVTVFKQFDALTDRFAVETLEIGTTDGKFLLEFEYSRS